MISHLRFFIFREDHYIRLLELLLSSLRRRLTRTWLLLNGHAVGTVDLLCLVLLLLGLLASISHAQEAEQLMGLDGHEVILCLALLVTLQDQVGIIFHHLHRFDHS